MERYAAFISYSHADKRVAHWLHRSIESYRYPSALVGQPSEFGPVPRKLPPVFRDRDDLPGSADLNSQLCAALQDSRFQIVICSPAAARSHWVNEEILQFKRMHGEKRTLALIVAGEPFAGGTRNASPRRCASLPPWPGWDAERPAGRADCGPPAQGAGRPQARAAQASRRAGPGQTGRSGPAKRHAGTAS